MSRGWPPPACPSEPRDCGVLAVRVEVIAGDGSGRQGTVGVIRGCDDDGRHDELWSCAKYWWPNSMLPPCLLPPCSLPPSLSNRSLPPSLPPQANCLPADEARTLLQWASPPLPTHKHTQVNCQLAAAHTSPSMGIGFLQSGALCQVQDGALKRGGPEGMDLSIGSDVEAVAASEEAPAASTAASDEEGGRVDVLGPAAAIGCCSSPRKRSRALFLRQRQQQGGQERPSSSAAAVEGNSVSVWGEHFSWTLGGRVLDT